MEKAEIMAGKLMGFGLLLKADLDGSVQLYLGKRRGLARQQVRIKDSEV